MQVGDIVIEYVKTKAKGRLFEIVAYDKGDDTFTAIELRSYSEKHRLAKSGTSTTRNTRIS